MGSACTLRDQRWYYDRRARQRLAEIPVGRFPNDTASYEEVKRLPASRNPWSLALSPDGKRFLVTNTLSRFVEFRTRSMSEVTVLDSERAFVEDRFVVPAASILQGVAWHPSGDLALVTCASPIPRMSPFLGWEICTGHELGLGSGRGSGRDQTSFHAREWFDLRTAACLSQPHGKTNGVRGEAHRDGKESS